MTIDELKIEFTKWLSKETGEPEHLVMLMQSVYVSPESMFKFYSHSLAEARREERERIIAILERTRGFAGMPDSTKNVLGNLVFDLRNKSDLLTGDNPERKV